MLDMFARLSTHTASLVLMVIVFFSSITLPSTVESVSAAEESPAVVRHLLETSDANTLPRSELSTREYRSFLPPPSPVPTPIPTPTPTKPPVAVTVAPRAIVVGSGVLSWPLPVNRGVNTYFSSGHKAVDLEAHCGVAVLAARGGTILGAGWVSNGGGNVITQSTDNGLILTYDHLAAFLVTSGSVVAGQQIGSVGNTGRSKGCHLHFGVMDNGKWVNPLLYL